MEVVQTLDGGRRNAYDPDEIEEEQRERERRNKINHEFSQFVKRVQELWEKVGCAFRRHGESWVRMQEPRGKLGGCARAMVRNSILRS